MATKHEQILKYIDELPVGEKISVRQIAKDLTVSEGTAYRAIKDAENNKLKLIIVYTGETNLSGVTEDLYKKIGQKYDAIDL